MTLPELLTQSCQKYSHRPVFKSYEHPEERVTYAQLCVWQSDIAEWLVSKGVKQGDKVALWAHNSIQWCATFWAITSLGAIVVPLLPDLSIEQVTTILRHSESRLLLIGERVYKTDHGSMIHHKEMYVMEKILVFQSIPHPEDDRTIGCNASSDDVRILSQDIALIIYTSGTTGRPKGVVLSHHNITVALPYFLRLQKVVQEDIFLSILPLAHIYELTLGMLLPVYAGAEVIYMSGAPTPKVLMEALHEIRPTIMLIVPLIIEKIVNRKILADLKRESLTRLLLKYKITRRWVYRIAVHKLNHTFGGRLKLLAIGGAALDPETEDFLLLGKMRYSCGYGLTESAGLIFGAPVGKTRLHSVGPAREGVSFKIENANPQNPVGEILIRSESNMIGYYHEPNLTAEVLDKDRWLHTGDLGEIRNGYLYLRGRSKTMILGPNGENIYPEEIEALINEIEGIEESMVALINGRLVAKLYFETSPSQKRSEKTLKNIRYKINQRLSRFSQLARMEQVFTPFEKTATHKIKR